MRIEYCNVYSCNIGTACVARWRAARAGPGPGVSGGCAGRDGASAPPDAAAARRLPACTRDAALTDPPHTDVHMDNSCLLDLLIRCFAMTEPEDLNFTAFTDLCRLCSLKSGPRLHIFDKEAEQRQILFKLRTCLPTMVSYYKFTTITS